MRSVLFLSVVMGRGYGVSVAIEEVARGLMARGVPVVIGCERYDWGSPTLDVRVVGNTLQAVEQLAEELAPVIIVGVTTPYFEILPLLAHRFDCWAWEHGDPTPALFQQDRVERGRIILRKQRESYPAVRGVIVPSEFLKHDINWAPSIVVYNGCDHAPFVPPKTLRDLQPGFGKPLKIGALMRMGPGEACYKGNHLFIEMVKAARSADLSVEAHAAGRGTPQDAEPFEELGIIPHLNLSDEDKYEYLRGLDLFFSFSLWEGFNLPLIEAQAMGTMSLCLDAGAHPEVCPFLLNTPRQGLQYIERALQDRSWLGSQSSFAYRFVRKRFQWDQAAEAFKGLLGV